ncbi:unnamed protein product [Symbiodinium pilosum]|uniref:R3H domain-containing protein n=1 Tax=Symbiodinium pilosum TaxID=2952 RepID=A0A812JG83_SYMPI|nr:unnamed protein product [Symbiodinium pilosum]
MEADGSAAFPNPWLAHAKGRGQGKGREKGQKGGKDRGKGGKGGKGGGKGGKNNGKGPGDLESLPQERREDLMSQLQALAQGREPQAVPRVGDVVELRILGGDRLGLHGRRGTVRGAVPASNSLLGGAFTVRLDCPEGEEEKEVTASASDLQIMEAALPLPEASLLFPKTLTGLERKFVHASAETLGLISQSFGEGAERYITAFRPAQKAVEPAEDPTEPEAKQPEAPLSSGDQAVASVDCSGVELDAESRERLLDSITVPGDWQTFADRLLVCRGRFSSPRDRDNRSIAEEAVAQVRGLHLEASAEMRVATLAQGDQAIAVGVLGVPALDRNPHVLVAAAPGRSRVDALASLRSCRWVPWTGAPLLLRGRLKQWEHEPEAVSER